MGFRPLAGLLLGALIVLGAMADTHYQGGMYFAGPSGAPGKRIVNM